MRLTRFQIDSINKLAKKHFGQETTVYLFGSRTDDHKKGGDIDLLINNTQEETLSLEAKIRFLAQLKAEIGDRKIDVVFDNDTTRQKKNFYRSIIRQRVEL
ncbi:nucleotidyltransferase domain-containing protein [Gaoshiqia sediminis]|uniref:Nucleotidyltransferase domain-containing protein n=1 Tax=Gaoshiqia sediminis TaxID=2986998 RepID=A0AA41YDY6_9BACT|nr:nucleotidyltransferase domain-containing protein [Gaoshiqia sediminis]MCW0485050.1 nucleotidyltransferase domain-containing protein [Gaoshiqia sediminis]